MVTITDVSAMRIYARGGQDSLMPLSASGLDWSIGSARELRDCNLGRMGLELREDDPVHVLVSGAEKRVRSRGVRCHVWTGRIPSGSLLQLAPGVLVVSPGFCCLQMASYASIPRVASIEMECLGLYGRTSGSRGFLDRGPLLSKEELGAFLDGTAACQGSKKARRALGACLAPARSPLETKVALLLTLPPSLGGYGLPKPEMNCVIRPTPGEFARSQFPLYEVDLCWSSRKVVVEVDSYRYHSEMTSLDRDAKRRNSLTSMGWRVFSVTSGQLSGDTLDVLATQLSHCLGSGGRPAPERRDWLLEELG